MPLLIDLLGGMGDVMSLQESCKDLAVRGISADSSKVKDGYVFVAIKGDKRDGTDFIPQAIANGAMAIVMGKDSVVVDCDIPVVMVEEARLALAKMAVSFYRRQSEKIVAITGTDGKTSVADFFRQIMHSMGDSSASIGTIGVIAGDGKNLYPEGLTTPDPVELHRILDELVSGGIDYLAMEASSHGLSQYRLDGVNLSAAAFTNFGRDHLDYHKTPEAYFSAKSRLFKELLPAGRNAVLNCDDKMFPELESICKERGHDIIGFGKNTGELKIESIVPDAYGQEVKLTLFGKKYNSHIPLVGEFQVMNVLAAIGLAVSVGGNLEKILGLIQKLKGVSGRLELAVRTQNDASIFVDFAHTPLALANILKTLREHTAGKLYLVFGCGGDRDKGKRPQMGKIAGELADYSVVTDDNPRSEDPRIIRKEVLEGFMDRNKCVEVAGREEAIYVAVEKLKKGDVLVIAGKGHEKNQIVGDQKLPFDDVKVACAAADKLNGVL
ncbi:MAG: UDP-N-acetylmuramoyl-L-alanyl-D-glutamate--2,6-diaminopimelate ligase [Rickettsiales bacterium]